MIDNTARTVNSSIGKGVEIREFCTIHNSSIESGCKIYERTSVKKSSIGKGSDINAGVYIENAEIGEYVQVAPNCIVVGVTHGYSIEGISHTDRFDRIFIGNGSWLGASSIVLPGVRIGEGTIIGAGAIVNEDVPDRHVYIGTPMKKRVYPIDSK